MNLRVRENFRAKIKPISIFLKNLFTACYGRRLTVLWIAFFTCFFYVSSQHYVKILHNKLGLAIDISEISSNDHVFFFVRKKIASYHEVKKGDYISFTTDKMMPFVSNHAQIVKKVVGKKGDRVDIIGSSVMINGIECTKLNLNSLKKLNKSVDQMQTSYIIPDNNLFVLGSNPRSYDSRYWGLLPIDPKQKIDIAKPILF